MMEKLKSLGLCALTSLLMLTPACGDSDLAPRGEKGTGRMNVFADLNTSVISSRSVDSRAEADAVDASALHLVLTSADGQNVYDLGTLGEYDSSKSFPVGNYYLEAKYGDEKAEGFESPYYYGKSDVVRITDGETTQVGVTAGLGNSMFTVTYTDALKKYLTDYNAEILSAGSTVPVKYAKDETRAAYVRPGDVDIYVNVTKPSGKSARLLAATVSAQPRHRYNVTVDMNDGEVGEGALNITFDDTLEAEDVNIDLSDDLMNAPAPTLVLNGDPTIEYVETTANKAPVKYNIIAMGMIAKVTLNTTNAAAVSADWPETIDLMRADQSTRAKLEKLGLKVRGLWQNPDKMAVVDLTDVVSNITDNGSPVTFSLNVVDRTGKANEEDKTVTVNVHPIAFSIENVGYLIIGSSKLAFNLVYNGDNPADVKYCYKNERGTITQTSAAEIESTPYENVYSVVINVPDDGDLTFYATNGKIRTDEITVKRIVSPTYKIALADAMATKASFTVEETEAPNEGKSYSQYATLYLSTDGTNFSEAPTTFDADALYAASLQPSTTYTARISLSGSVNAAKELTFTTEAAAQIPGADMESWSSDGGNANWNVAIPATPWATLNALTTSDPGSTSAAWNAVSGTTPAPGSNGTAACIATVGWGADNTAATRGPLLQGFPTLLHCSNVTVGELYVGTFDAATNAPVYGTAFTSRPSSMSFYYKYTAKASADKGTAYVAVLDADGNVLASGSTNLSVVREYTEVTIPLEYTSATKAASLQVVFKSSIGGYETVNTTNLNYPAIGTSDKTQRYYGSELYVDDVTLNY